MKSEVYIRGLTLEKINEVLEIQLETGLSAWTAEDYRTELNRNNSICLAAETNRALLGFIVMRLIGEFEGEIYNLGVRRDAQGRGIGGALLKDAISWAAGKSGGFDGGRIWLEVRASNRQAIEFYQKNGFGVEGLRRNFYRNPPDDAIIMKHVTGVGKVLDASLLTVENKLD